LHSTGNETVDLVKQTAPDHAGAEVCGVDGPTSVDARGGKSFASLAWLS